MKTPNFFQRVAMRMIGIDPAAMRGGRNLMGIAPGLSAVRPSLAPGLDVDGIRGIIDMAEQGQTDDLFRLYADMIFSDADLIAALTQRKAGFISKPWNFEVPKDASPALKDNTEFLKRQLKDHAGFNELLPYLPTGGLWPVAVAKQSYKPGTRGNYYDLDRVSLKTWTVLDFTGGLSEKPAGTLGIKCVSPDGAFTGGLEWPEDARGTPALGWVVHRGNVLADMMPDAWGGPLRAAVMWWFFALQVRQLWVNYAEHGSYLLIGKHEANDADGKNALLAAFDDAKRTTGIAVSAETDVDVHNLATQSGGDVYFRLINYAGDQLLKVILGSTMTVKAAAQGFGGNQSGVQQDSTGDVFVMDAVFSERTVKAQVFAPLLSINGRDARELPGISWGGKSEDQGKLADVIAKLKSGGIKPSAPALTELSERMGFALEFDTAAGGPGLPGLPPGPGARTFAVDPTSGSRRKLLMAALMAGEEIDRAAAAGLARAGRAQFAGLDRALRNAETPAEALAAADDWLATFSVEPLAGALEESCCAHAANGWQKSAGVAGLPP